MNKKVLMTGIFALVIVVFVAGLIKFGKPDEQKVPPVASESEVEDIVAEEPTGDEIVGEPSPDEVKEDEIVVETPVEEPVQENPVETVSTITTNVTEKEAIPFATREVKDDTLEKGKTVVSVAGKDGIKLITYKITKEGEKEISKEKVSEKIELAPVDKVVKVGNKTVVTSTPKPSPTPTTPKPTPTPVTPTPTPTPAPTPKPQPVVKTFEDVKTESIAFKTEEREDNTLEAGQTRVTQEGVNGVKTIKYQVTTTDGKEIARKLISEEVTRQPVNKIVLKGTKAEETWRDRISRQVPSGYSVQHTAIGSLVYKSGKYVGAMNPDAYNMELSFGRGSLETLADFWIVYRKEFGLSTNRTDLFTAIDKYYADGSFGSTGNFNVQYDVLQINIRHN